MRSIVKLLILPISASLIGLVGCDSNPGGPAVSAPAPGTAPAPPASDLKPGAPPGAKGKRTGLSPASAD